MFPEPFSPKDVLFMQRCIEIASFGKGHVLSNPMVGCVIVNGEKIISEGYHHFYGGLHAEADAISKINSTEILKNSVLYVNLEPCSHTGKTPPCADLIIAKGIPEVIVSVMDPNPIVAGNGINKLKKNGIKVKTGLCEKESIYLNKRFFTFHQKQRPYVILKWAQTKDNYIDLISEKAQPNINWISNKYSRQLVHKWRTEEMGILIGSNTALRDNPKLTSRDWYGRNPVRFLIDKELEVNLNYEIFNEESETYCFYSASKQAPVYKSQNIHFIPIDFKDSVLPIILRYMFSLGIVSVIVEGGKETLESFIKENLWDEARVITGDKYFKMGVPAPAFPFIPVRTEQILEDSITFYQNTSV